MTDKHLQNILTDYSQMSVNSLIELKNLIEDYPYCQTAQILYLLNLRRLEEDTFDTRLPYTAICVNNRQRLKCAVEQVDEILAKESGTRYEVASTTLSHRSSSGVETIKPRTQYPAISHQTTFRNKTISELLNLQEPKPSAVTQIKLPKTQTSEDFLLEQLRQETLAKVNERLLEIRKTEMVDVDFSETPKHKALIDKVIATNPKISKMDDLEISRLSHWKIKEENSMRENFDVTSETLALLYVAQGAPEKAREIYKALGKKYPEKAEHFAHLSKQIKSTKTTNTINSKSNNHKPKTKK
ncbi:MAG: hypothetical protein LBH22_09540 [Bacteroidales bacterium]|jgi:hypothetical protein|nr:hypothetical protein [Bacteroidales bacterium]